MPAFLQVLSNICSCAHLTKPKVLIYLHGVTNADLDVDAALGLQMKLYAVLLVAHAVYVEPQHKFMGIKPP